MITNATLAELIKAIAYKTLGVIKTDYQNLRLGSKL